MLQDHPMRSLWLIAVSIILSQTFAVSGYAATQTRSIGVHFTIIPICKIDSASSGTQVVVQCTQNTPFSVDRDTLPDSQPLSVTQFGGTVVVTY